MRAKSLDSLCNIAAGLASVTALVIPGVSFGAIAAAFASGILLDCISEHRRADFDRMLKRVGKQIAKDYSDWITQDSQTDRLTHNDIDVAMASFQEAMEILTAAPHDYIENDLNGERLAGSLLRRAEIKIRERVGA